MTIRHLKIFISVVEYKTMRKASEHLFISQSSISQAIQELEKRYNIKLFERLNQKLYLTDDGKSLLPYARHVVDSFDSLDLMMQNKGQQPKLRIGGSVSVGTYLLNDLVDKIEEKIPNLDSYIIINNTTVIEDMILNSHLDVAVVEGIVESEQIIQTPIYHDELVVIVGKTHKLFNCDIVEIKDLEKEVWISREEGSIARNQYEQIFVDHGFKIQRKWICSNIDNIKNLVIKGKGITVVSKYMISNEIKNIDLKILNVRDVSVNRKIHLIYHKDKYLSPSIRTFIDICTLNS